MELTTAGNMGEFVELVVGNLTYLGPTDLTQYFIRGTDMYRSDDETQIIVEIRLGRRLLGVILTVFIPTFMMIVLSYMTNFFKPFFFEADVEANVTLMMVNDSKYATY